MTCSGVVFNTELVNRLSLGIPSVSVNKFVRVGSRCDLPTDANNSLFLLKLYVTPTFGFKKPQLISLGNSTSPLYVKLTYLY